MSPVIFGKHQKRQSRRSHLEEQLAQYIAGARLPAPIRELRFAPPRMWRFDFAWPELMVAVEIEGGIFVQGGHSRGIDFTDDCEKYGIATLLGWRVYRFTVKQFESGWVFQFVRAVVSQSETDRRALLLSTVGTASVQPRLLMAAASKEER